MLVRLARRRWVIIAVGVLVASGFGVAFVATRTSIAESGPAPGLTVPVEYRPYFFRAAKSCPALSAAKLAGQVMAESGFSEKAVGSRDGGSGTAGLTDAEWKVWKPTSDASRSDAEANIIALAHLTCDLIGRIRVAGINGDPWQLATAAFYSGIDAVTKARAVPDLAAAYVDRVVGYATWYAQQPDLEGPPPTTVAVPSSSEPTSEPTSAPPTTSATTAVPTTRPNPPAVAPATARTTAPPPRTTAPTVAAPVTSGELWNDEFHACLSAVSALDGTHLVLAGCDGSMVQHWQPGPGGTIRAAGLCMDAANAGTADFTPVQVANCSGNPAQLFTMNGDHHLYSPYANKCVNIHFTAGVGTSIVLYSCLNQSNQVWTYRKQ